MLAPRAEADRLVARIAALPQPVATGAAIATSTRGLTSKSCRATRITGQCHRYVP